MRPCTILMATLALILPLAAQCNLTTTFAGGNGANGNMFDVVSTASEPIEITGFAVNVGVGSHTIEVWAANNGGTYVGREGNSAAWTLLWTGPVTSLAGNAPTQLPAELSVILLPGARQAFYVTTTGATILSYTNGTTEGQVFSSDANLQILEGIGCVYPFGFAFRPRNWNGTVQYRKFRPSCPASPYQRNHRNASLTFNDVEGTNNTPAVTRVFSGSTFAMRLGSDLFNPWELAMVTDSTPVALGGGGILMPSGTQSFNLSLLDPTFTTLGDGSYTRPLLPFRLPITLQMGTGDRSVSLQMVMLDPASPDFATISQPATLEVEFSLPLNSGDDVTTTFSLVGAPFFLAPMPFAGTRWNEVHVVSNGRITFGNPNAAYWANVADALSQGPFFGYWSDLVDTTGNSTATPADGRLLTIDYVGVGYYRGNLAGNFSLSLNVVTGEVAIDGMMGVAPPSGSTPVFCGLSVGNRGATDAGPVSSFAAGSTGISANGSMIYQLGSPSIPSLGTFNRINFVPAGPLDFGWLTL